MNGWHERAAKALARNFGWVVACCIVAVLLMSKTEPPPVITQPEPSYAIITEQKRLYEDQRLLRNALQNQINEEVDAIKEILDSVAYEVESEDFSIDRFLNEVESHCQRLRRLRKAIERLDKGGMYIR